MSTSSSDNKKELTFELTITNGAAKLLQRIKDKLKKDSAKEVVSTGLQIIDYALREDAELLARKKDGTEVRIVFKDSVDG